MTRTAAIWLLAAMLVLVRSAVAVEAEWIMYRDPVLAQPVDEIRFPSGLPALWSQALEMPRSELRRRAASAIASAHEMGLAGLEVTSVPLMQLLTEPEQERTVRLTAAHALITLDAREAADLLFQQLHPGDLDMAELVEPALARWKHPPMREIWLKRLQGPISVRRLQILAIRGLALLAEPEALPRLLQLAQDRDVAASVRVEAAVALGKLQQTGLEDAAQVMIENKTPESVVERLVAAKMLDSHQGEATQRLLTELATDPQPSVQGVALAHLARIDPELIMPVIDTTITSPDVNVRRVVADALVTLPNAEKIARLSHLLDDPNPGLRQHICDCCVKLASDTSLSDAVVQQGRQVLAADGWRGQEQAILLLVTLDDKSIADRLLALLESPRPEVHTTAAWGLSRLEVASTLEPILAIFRVKTEQWLEGRRQVEQTNVQLSHLAQAMGKMDYAAADEVLRQYIPKGTVLDADARGAAIWAVGRLHADKPDEALAAQLMDRIEDMRSMLAPEDPHVGAVCAVALGRMKATSELAALRDFSQAQSLHNEAGVACAWAISQITGEPMPDIPPRIVMQANWFLTPVEQQ